MHLLHLEREQRLHLGGRKTVCLKDRVRPALWVSCRADLPIEVVIVPRKTRGGTIPTRVKEELDRTNVVRRPALALQQEQARDIRVGIRAEAIRATEAGIRVPDLILAHRADIKASKAQDVAQQAMVGNKGKAQGGTLVGRDLKVVHQDLPADREDILIRRIDLATGRMPVAQGAARQVQGGMPLVLLPWRAARRLKGSPPQSARLPLRDTKTS